jgi:F-type H+-transporting ATPase subunit epsilon
MLLDVMVLNPQKVIFEGKAESVILPGEQGVFEVLSFHKRMLSRLITGILTVGNKNFYIRRGVAKVDQNKLTIIIEEKRGS